MIMVILKKINLGVGGRGLTASSALGLNLALCSRIIPGKNVKLRIKPMSATCIASTLLLHDLKRANFC